MGTVQIQTLQAKVKMNLTYLALFLILAVTVKSGPNPRAKANAEAKPKADPKARMHRIAPYPPIYRPGIPYPKPIQTYPPIYRPGVLYNRVGTNQYPKPIQKYPPINRLGVSFNPDPYCGSSSLPCYMCAEWICAEAGKCVWDYHRSDCYRPEK